MTNREYIDIGLIKALMKSRGINQKQLASLSSIAPVTLKRLLNGADQGHMSSIIILKLSAALDVAPHSIIHKDYR